jgi:hypothetical protein
VFPPYFVLKIHCLIFFEPSHPMHLVNHPCLRTWTTSTLSQIEGMWSDSVRLFLWPQSLEWEENLSMRSSTALVHWRLDPTRKRLFNYRIDLPI